MEKEVRLRQLSEFLRTRRAKITPAEVGLPVNGRRRTPGLRREEVAQLAGVGVDWYTWLEQGRDIHASEQVLTSIARILRLNDAETRYLFTLAYGSDFTPRMVSVSPVLQSMLDSLDTTPAILINHLWDMVAWNESYSALLGGIEHVPPADRNSLWMSFTDPFLRQILVDWEGHMQAVVAQFRADFGNNPGDPQYVEIVERLLNDSPEFRAWWPRHDVLPRDHRRKEYHHPVVGHLVMEQNTFHLSEHPEIRLVMLIPMPGTPTVERLRRLMEIARAESIAT